MRVQASSIFPRRISSVSRVEETSSVCRVEETSSVCPQFAEWRRRPQFFLSFPLGLPQFAELEETSSVSSAPVLS